MCKKPSLFQDLRADLGESARDDRLTAEDRQRLVEHWYMWSKLSIALNGPFKNALKTLDGLLQAKDIPVSLVAYINDVADETAAAPAAPPPPPPPM